MQVGLINFIIYNDTNSLKVAWSYIDRWDENHTVIIYQAEDFSEDYAEFAQNKHQ